MRTIRRSIWMVVIAVAAAGCAAKPAVRDEHLGRGIEGARYRVAQVRVEGEESVRSKIGFDPTAAALRESFIGQLQASGKFAEVIDAPAPSGKGLEIQLRVTSFNYAHAADRGLMAAAGPRAVLSVTMMVTDIETKDLLGSASAAHASSRTQGMGAPTSGRQADAIGKELADRLASVVKP